MTSLTHTVRLFLVFSFLFCFQSILLGQTDLLTFNFDGIAGNETTYPSNFNITGLDPSEISRGAGVTATGKANRFNSKDWTTTSSVDNNDYLEFTIYPVAGYTVSISSVRIFHQRSGTGPIEFALRISTDAYGTNVGTGNPFNNGDVTATQDNTVNTESVIDLQNFTAPVSFRLYGYSAEGSTGSWGPGDHSGDDIIIAGSIISSGTTTYYSSGSGDFHAADFWSTSSGGAGAITYPTPGLDDIFIIQAGHAVTINTGDVTASGITVEGDLNLSLTSATMTLNNGMSGADLMVNGTFTDNGSSSNGAAFNSGATWALGSGATFIKTNSSSATVYRDNYHNGMSNIPASANWIVRKTGASEPSFTTINTFYPNLTFESTAGTWTWTQNGQSFTGSSSTAVIYGNLNIGGSGASVMALNDNTNSTPITVNGDFNIQSGSSLSNFGGGTGLRINGNINFSGQLNFSYGTGNAGVIELGGSGTQNITGGGTVQLRNLTVDKSGTAYLLRYLTVSNLLKLSSGYIDLTAYDLTLSADGSTQTVSGGSASTYVVTSGAGFLVQNVGAMAKSFPVGQSAYNPAVVINAGAEDAIFIRLEDDMTLTSDVVNRTWVIEEASSGGSVVDLSLQWNSGEEKPGFNSNSCYITHFVGGVWDNHTPAPAITGSGVFTQSRSGITSFSPFGVSSAAVLPVELTNFDALRKDQQVLLTWKTAAELDNDYFDVERSMDGVYFEKIGSRAGVGNSNTLQSYSMIDETPGKGWNYYRLAQVDFSGKIQYSPVRSVFFKGDEEGLQLFPNPSNGQVNLLLDSPLDMEAEIVIFSVDGRIIQRSRMAAEQLQTSLDLAFLPAGTYFIRLITERNIFTQRLIRQ